MDRQKGPIRKGKFDRKFYSGELSRSEYGCTDGGTDWQPLEVLLNKPELIKQTEMTSALSDLKKLFDPKEKTALMCLYIASVPVWLLLILFVITTMGGLLVFVGLVWLTRAIGEMWFAAYVKTNAIRVSERQLPEVYQVAKLGCDKLGMKYPEVYVLQQNVWNAFATKIFGRRMVVLLSGAVDSILLKGDHQQLAFLVGHELGHHWAGHLDLRQKLARLGGVVVWLGLWHSRRAELTCDRVGLYCAGSLKASQLALINATVGAQLANRVAPEEAIAQWRQHRGEFFVRYRTLYSTHPHLLARIDHLNEAATELAIA